VVREPSRGAVNSTMLGCDRRGVGDGGVGWMYEVHEKHGKKVRYEIRCQQDRKLKGARLIAPSYSTYIIDLSILMGRGFTDRLLSIISKQGFPLAQ
jgi:hypothetical protein